jgi:hypothetical protein
MKSAVEIITDWIEKNIDVIYYPKNDDTGEMHFNKQFVLRNLSGVMPDVKKALNNKTPNK